MKQKLKKFLLLSLLTGTLFVSCELQEDYHSKKEYEGKMKISHKNFSELLNDRKFNKAYGEVLQKKNIMSRTVMEDQYQFTIANGLANVIETDSDVTYTLLIKRDSIEENTIENLIVKIDSLSETTAYIVKFKGKLGAIPSYNNLNDDTIEKVVTPIVYNSNIASKEIYECYEISYWVCYYPGHTDTGVCTHGEYETMEFCEVVGYDFGNDNIVIIGDGGGGSGGSSSSDSNYNGTDGSIHGSDSATPINMAPILELEEETIIDKCKSLAKLIDPSKANIQSILNALNPNSGVEEGNSFQINSSNYTNPTIPNFGDTNIHIPVGPNIYGAIHTHTPELGNMFSWGDLKTLERLYKNTLPENREDVVFMLKNSDGYIYAIKIDDFRLFRQFIHMKTQNLKDQHPNWNELRIQKALNEKTNFQSRYFNYQEKHVQESFLNFIQNSGVSLYQLNQDLTTNEYSFTQISLPYNNQTADLTKTKCN